MDFIFNAETAVVAKQTIINRSGDAEVKALSSKGKFSISRKALSLLDFDIEKDVVVIMDLGADSEVPYAVCKGFEVDGKMLGAKVNIQHQFSYSGIWNKVMFPNELRNLNTMTNTEIHELGLLRKTVLKNETERFSSDKNVAYSAKEITEDDEVVESTIVAMDADGEPIYRKVLLLTDRTEKQVTQRDIDDENDIDSIEEGMERGSEEGMAIGDE